MDHDPGEGISRSPSLSRGSCVNLVSRDANARARRDRSWSSAALFFSPGASKGRDLAGLRDGLRDGSRLLAGLRVATPAGTKGTAPGDGGALRR